MKRLLEIVIAALGKVFGRSDDFVALSTAWALFTKQVNEQVSAMDTRLKACEADRILLWDRITELEGRKREP